MFSAQRVLIAVASVALVFAGAFGIFLFSDRDGGTSPQTALAQDYGDNRGIHVEGEGQVAVTPDTAKIILGVELDGTDLDSMRADANSRMNDVIDALIDDFGISEEDVRTIVYDISVREEAPDPREPARDVAPSEPDTEVEEEATEDDATDDAVATDEAEEVEPDETTYVLVQLVQVRVTDIDQVGAVIDAALDAGANRVGNISFEVEDRAEAIEQARAMAVDEARAKAEHLAELTGVTVGQPLRINEWSPSGPAIRMEDVAMDAEMAAEEMEARIQPGESVISVSVNIVYAID